MDQQDTNEQLLPDGQQENTESAAGTEPQEAPVPEKKGA